MRLSVVLLACVLAGGVFSVAGLRLSSAIGQVSAIAALRPAEGGTDASVADSRADGGPAVVPMVAAAPESVGALADSDVPADAAENAPASTVDERELGLDYFGPDVSLNDIGQLASPDPEFERAIRERANEIGEIPAEP